MIKRLRFFYSKLVPQVLLKITQALLKKEVHKRYSKISPQVLIKIDPQELPKIGSTNVT